MRLQGPRKPGNKSQQVVQKENQSKKNQKGIAWKWKRVEKAVAKSQLLVQKENSTKELTSFILKSKKTE